METISIIVPAYNEEKVIAETVRGIQAEIQNIKSAKFEIICVNDGSSDQTGEILSQLKGIRVITHHLNRGYGAALRTGLDLYQ